MSARYEASQRAQAEAHQSIQLKQQGAELVPRSPVDLSRAHLRLGIDVGSTTVKLRYENKVYAGKGVSTDVIGASIRAYLAAVNKICYEAGVK